jgi:hypothetical protein
MYHAKFSRDGASEAGVGEVEYGEEGLITEVWAEFPL